MEAMAKINSAKERAARSEAASIMGKLGGKSRMAGLTGKERSDLVRKSVNSRWAGMTAEQRQKATEKMRAARKAKAKTKTKAQKR